MVAAPSLALAMESIGVTARPPSVIMEAMVTATIRRNGLLHRVDTQFTAPSTPERPDSFTTFSLDSGMRSAPLRRRPAGDPGTVRSGHASRTASVPRRNVRHRQGTMPHARSCTNRQPSRLFTSTHLIPGHHPSNNTECAPLPPPGHRRRRSCSHPNEHPTTLPSSHESTTSWRRLGAPLFIRQSLVKHCASEARARRGEATGRAPVIINFCASNLQLTW